MPKKPKNAACTSAARKLNSSRNRKLEQIAASITAYYDSLTDEEVADDKAWGEFGMTQFPDE